VICKDGDNFWQKLEPQKGRGPEVGGLRLEGEGQRLEVGKSRGKWITG